MTELFPYQVEGARFLADRKRALLADGMRVGKTGAGVGAADNVGAEDILEITKGGARRNHARAWRDFQTIKRKVTPIYSASDYMPHSGVIITSYTLATGALLPWLKIRGFDVIIPDECHHLNNQDAARTKAVYGENFDGDGGLIDGIKHVWLMSGTPAPKDYSQLWTMLRATMPDAIIGKNGKPMSFSVFKAKYCKFRNTGFGDVIVGNKNSADLKARLAPYMLRRTLKDVRPDHPDLMYDVLELDATSNLTELKELERSDLVKEFAQALDAAPDQESQDIIIKQIEKTVGMRLRRLTGLAKVVPMVDWVEEQIDDGLEKIVLFAHHRDVIEGLHETLEARGISSVKIYGGMSSKVREAAQDEFQISKATVAIGQIEAAGEAIDLSAADQLVFVESSYVPGPNDQAAHRVVNVMKPVSTLARFATLPGSIDEKIQRVALRRTIDIAKLFN